ncbi:MAG: PTS sugar transporter subunit IIA [Alphaproteobacteria bacterium]
MIGIVLVTHGRLADEMLAAAVHVTGPQEQTGTVCIGPDDDSEASRRRILEAIEAVDDGDGVVLLTDMFGGTPSNLAMSVLGHGRIDVIAGVNLPMLVKLATERRRLPLVEAVACAEEAGHKYIKVASRHLTEARR